jgi:hypothetical protein
MACWTSAHWVGLLWRLELNALLRGEPGKLVGLDKVGRLGRAGLLHFLDGLESETFRFQEVIGNVGSVGAFVGGSIRRALQVDSYIREFLTQDVGIHSYFLT